MNVGKMILPILWGIVFICSLYLLELPDVKAVKPDYDEYIYISEWEESPGTWVDKTIDTFTIVQVISVIANFFFKDSYKAEVFWDLLLLIRLA